MKDSMNSGGVSRAPVTNHRQIKKLSPEGRLSRVGIKSKFSRSSAARLKKHLGWYVAFNSKPLEEKIAPVPQIKWTCPPKFALSTGCHIAAGEGSHEAEIQTCRETTVREVVYHDLTAIPPSPFTWPQMEGECYDGSPTPVIPIIPVEEVAAEMTFDTSSLVNTCISQQPLASDKVPSVSGDLPSSQCKPSCSHDQPVHDRSLPNMLHGLESGDLEVAVAAATTVAAVMENKGQIDTELLIRFLTDPEMVKKLIDSNGFAGEPKNGTPPAPEPNTSLLLPSSTPAPVVNKLAAECSQQLSGTMNQSLVLPCSKLDTGISKSACTRDGIHTGSGSIRTLKREKKSILSPRSNSHIPSVENLTSEPGAPDHSHTHQIARVQQLRPLMPCSLRPDEETMNRLIKKYAPPEMAGSVPVAHLNPSTSMPNVEAVKKLIRAYGAPDASWLKPVTPLIASTSRPLNMEAMKNINEYGVVHGWGKPSMGPSPLLPAPTPLRLATTMHALPNALESSFTPTGNFRSPFFYPVTVPAPKADLNYHKSLIKQYGEKHETEGQKLPKIGQPGNYLQGLESGHKNTTSIVMNSKYRKSCIFQ